MLKKRWSQRIIALLWPLALFILIWRTFLRKNWVLLIILSVVLLVHGSTTEKYCNNLVFTFISHISLDRKIRVNLIFELLTTSGRHFSPLRQHLHFLRCRYEPESIAVCHKVTKHYSNCPVPFLVSYKNLPIWPACLPWHQVVLPSVRGLQLVLRGYCAIHCVAIADTIPSCNGLGTWIYSEF